MAAKVSTITVGTSAVQLNDVPADHIPGYSISVRNVGAASVWIGGPDVNTSDKGWEIEADGVLALDLDATESIYGRSAGSVDVRIFQTGV